MILLQGTLGNPQNPSLCCALKTQQVSVDEREMLEPNCRRAKKDQRQIQVQLKVEIKASLKHWLVRARRVNSKSSLKTTSMKTTYIFAHKTTLKPPFYQVIQFDLSLYRTHFVAFR